nr:hypothetical protein CFP56_05032 [Quercus suber]
MRSSSKRKVWRPNMEAVFRKDDHLEKAKKEVEEAVKNFKASAEYSDRMMVEYADGFELLQKYLVKHHPDLNFAMEATLISAIAVNIEVEVRSVEGDAGSTVPVTSDANVE